MIDSETMRVASTTPNANDFDKAANPHGTLESDALSGAATVVQAVRPETIAPVDKSTSRANVVLRTPNNDIGGISWLLRVIAALGGALAIGLLAWFLIKPHALADVWVRLSD